MKSSIRREIKLDLEKALSSASNKQVANQVGSIAQKRILDRTEKGQYLGGAKAKKGYSTKPIMAWKFGATRYNPKDKSITVSGRRVGRVKLSKDDLAWSNKGARLLGGYKKFRELKGLNTNVVNLSFSASMLNSLNFSVKRLKKIGTTITLTVSPSQQEKAYYTNLQREWLNLSDTELDSIAKFIESRFKI